MKYRFEAASFALLVTVATTVVAREPTRGAQCATAEQVAAVAAACHAAEEDTRRAGTKASPLAVDVITVPGASDDEKRERAADRDERAFSDRMLIGFTAVLALGTLLLWWATRRLVLDAKLNAEKQLRAYVSVESSSLVLAFGSSQPEAAVTFKNYGNTPAYEFTINSGIGMAPSFEELPPPSPEQPGEPRGVLSPGATAVLVRTGPVPLHPEHLAMLADGRSTIFVYGEVRYTDVFKKRRVLKYRLMTGDRIGRNRNALLSCDKGNDAD
jgi:hypothetical protein